MFCSTYPYYRPVVYVPGKLGSVSDQSGVPDRTLAQIQNKTPSLGQPVVDKSQMVANNWKQAENV